MNIHIFLALGYFNFELFFLNLWVGVKSYACKVSRRWVAWSLDGICSQGLHVMCLHAASLQDSITHEQRRKYKRGSQSPTRATMNTHMKLKRTARRYVEVLVVFGLRYEESGFKLIWGRSYLWGIRTRKLVARFGRERSEWGSDRKFGAFWGWSRTKKNRYGCDLKEKKGVRYYGCDMRKEKTMC